jgi:hypothetical protein
VITEIYLPQAQSLVITGIASTGRKKSGDRDRDVTSLLCEGKIKMRTRKPADT